MNPLVSIVVAHLPERKLISNFKDQTFKDFEVVIYTDVEHKGVAFARNKGVELCSPTSSYILFSDDDIVWAPYAVDVLLDTLEKNPQASYSYGEFSWLDNAAKTPKTYIYGNVGFSFKKLLIDNYISANSLVRKKDVVPFDESLIRLVDWDFWLTLLEQKKIGVYCGKKIFRTVKENDSVSRDVILLYSEAKRIVMKKHRKLYL